MVARQNRNTKTKAQNTKQNKTKDKIQVRNNLANSMPD
jgi:hypothetical protein